MKRLTLCIALLLACAACTTTTPARFDDGDQSATYYPANGQPNAAGLQAAMLACDQRLGVDDGGTYPARDYKACMRQLGWRYGYTMRDGKYADPDPDYSGFTCHDFVVLGVVGNSCQND